MKRKLPPKVEQTVLQLEELSHEIENLDSFSPGQGYDPLGCAMCDIVYQDFTSEEKRLILENLSSDILKSLQQASIQSEMALEKSVIAEILERDNKPEFYDASVESFQKLIRNYPFTWSFSRGKGELELLKKMTGKQEITSNNSVFIYFGRSMLPLSALSLYFLTRCPILWIDPFEESRQHAQKFINEAERLNIIDNDAVKITDSMSDLVQWLSFYKNKEPYAYVLDSDYNIENVIKKIFFRKLPYILLTNTDGLAEIMYPKISMDTVTDYYVPYSAILPKHTQEIPKDFSIVLTHSSSDVYVSTLLFKRKENISL